MPTSEPIDNELIVCLDEPANESTHYSPRVLLRGWLILDEAETGLPTLEVLLEEHLQHRTVLRGGLLFSGTVLRAGSKEREVCLESLEISPSVREVKADGVPVKGRVFDIAGIINVSQLLPKNGQTSRLFTIAFCATIGSRRCISNVTAFSLSFKDEVPAVLGGFLYPAQGRVETSVLVFEGWVVKYGDSVASLELQINGIGVGRTMFGLSSQNQAKLLPDIAGSAACRFSGVALAAEISEALCLKSAENVMLNCAAKIVFCSGEEVSLPAPPLIWSARKHLPAEAPFGIIEKVFLSSRETVCVEGWIVNPSGTQEFIRIRSGSSEICFSEGADEGRALRRFSREEINAAYPAVSQARPLGFSLEANPRIFGLSPGKLFFEVEDSSSGEKSLLGPSSMCSVFEDYVISLQGKRNFLQKALHETRSTAALLRSLRNRSASRKRANEENIPERRAQRVLFVSHNLAPFEGAPKVLYELVRAVREKLGSSAELCLVSAREGRLRAAYEPLGVRVEVIEELMIFDLSLARYQRGLTRFMEICQEVSPGLVFANVIDSFFAVDGAARLGIPAIWTIHESVDPRFWFSELRPELRLKFLHQLPQAKRLLFVAAATERLFSDWREPGTTAVIPNGIDTARIAHEREALDRRAVRAELGVDDQCYMITCVGTTTRRKGQDVLLSAMPAVISGLKGRNAKLFLVGAREIDFLDLLREMIGKLGLHEYVQLVPETPEVGQYYAASDVVVIPSREESAPLVSLEAFAYGVPLVSTPAFGLSEQLEHGENALLVPVEDVESLSVALLRLAEDKELSERLVRSGRERLAAEFSLERMLDRYWLEISALMGG